MAVTSSRIPSRCLEGLLHSSEDVNVCIYCGSTKHTHDECEDPKRADIKKALDAVRAALEGESSGSDADMEQEGEKMKEEPDKADESTSWNKRASRTRHGPNRRIPLV